MPSGNCNGRVFPCARQNRTGWVNSVQNKLRSYPSSSRPVWDQSIFTARFGLCLLLLLISPSVGGHTQARTTFLVIFRPIFLEWKPGGVNLNGMPLGETPLDSKFGLAHASKKEDRRTVFEASSRKSELWKTSFNDPLTCDSYAQASKTSEPQCHIASLKRVLSL